MAWIREYAQQAGDPFSLRMPRKLRKLKVGKALGGLAKRALPIVSGFLPGGALVNSIAARFNVDPETVSAFARAYGYDMGDPGAPPPAKRRKTAGSGPIAKAKKKRTVRAQRSARYNVPQGKKPKAAPLGPQVGQNLKDAIGAVFGAGKKAIGGDFPGALGDVFQGNFMPHVGKGGGGHHRRMNPLNVKALRRAARRFTGFNNAIKSVNKSLPTGMKFTPPLSHRHTHGHRRGCKCVACRRAA